MGFIGRITAGARIPGRSRRADPSAACGFLTDRMYSAASFFLLPKIFWLEGKCRKLKRISWKNADFYRKTNEVVLLFPYGIFGFVSVAEEMVAGTESLIVKNID